MHETNIYIAEITRLKDRVNKLLDIIDKSLINEPNYRALSEKTVIDSNIELKREVTNTYLD